MKGKWKVLVGGCFLGAVTPMIVKQYGEKDKRKKLPLIMLEGEITSSTMINSGGINLVSKKGVIDKAFETDSPVVAILLNTPGGSPVESSAIYNYLTMKKKQKDKKLLVFVHEVAASGGCYISCAADEIFVDPSSIVGSVGVIGQSLDISQWMKQKGIKFNTYTAGESKAGINIFETATDEQLKKLEDTLTVLHDNFKSVVTAERKDLDKDAVFTGTYFVGQRGIDVGLADSIGRPFEVLQERYPDRRIVTLGASGVVQQLLSSLSLQQQISHMLKFF